MKENTTGRTILDLCDEWLENNGSYDRDKARVAKFYSGGVMETPEDQETLGLTDHSNLMVGRKVLKVAFEETFALFSQPSLLISFKLKDFGDGTPAEQNQQENAYSKAVDQFLRRQDPTFMHECQKMCDTHVMHGDSTFSFPPEEDHWRPFHGSILTDTDAPLNVNDDNFFRWAIASDVQISEVMNAVKNDAPGWSSHAKAFLRDEWKRLYDAPAKGTAATDFDRMYDMWCDLSYTEWEAQIQSGGEYNHWNSFQSSRFRAYFFYQKNFDDEASTPNSIPVDLHIVARFRSRNDTTDNTVLFHLPSAYPDVSNALYEFVLDANLGITSPSWSTLKGLAHVNYTPDRIANLLQSVLTNSAIDKATPLFQAVNASDLKILEKWISTGYRANSVVPAGLDLVDKQKIGSSVGEALQLVSFFQQQGNENAVGYTATSAPSSADELQVQARQRQQRDVRQANNRTTNFIRKLNVFCQEVGRRLSSRVWDDDPLVATLHDALVEKDVQIEWFYPENLTIQYVRLSGDGDPERRLQIAEHLMQRLALIPDEERPNVLSEWYTALTGDPERAEQIFGQGDQKSTDLSVMAFTKAASIMELGTPLPVTAEDMPAISLPVVIKVLKATLDNALKQEGFTQDKLDGFIALGRWGILLVQKLEAMGQNELAKTYQDAIQGLSREAEEPAKQLRDRQQQQQMDPETQEKLKLEAAKVQQSGQRLEFDQEKERGRTIQAQRRQDYTEYSKSRASMQQEDRLDMDRTRLDKDIVVAADNIQDDDE